MDLNTRILETQDYVIGLRHELHRHPEVAGAEERTTRRVVEELEAAGIRTEVVPHGGVIGVLEGGKPGRTIVLRADMDALPMKEDACNLAGRKGCVSEADGASHMCGHDAHTAMLLGAAKVLAQLKEEIRGKVIFAFEAGEENGYGIIALLSRLVEIGADGLWAIHMKADIPSGKISVTPGPRMSAVIPFAARIKGKGGHGSRPDLANNPLDCFVDIYQDMMTMRVKRLNPFDPITFSVCEVKTGTTANIIPEELYFSGTYRFLNYERSGQVAEQDLIRIITQYAELHGCAVEFPKPVKAINLIAFNNPDCSAIAAESVRKVLGEAVLIDYPAWMASESIGIYQRYFPGVFAFLGTWNEALGTGADHHNPKFDIDDSVLKIGLAATVQYTLDFLESEQPIRFQPYRNDVPQLMKEIGFL